MDEKKEDLIDDWFETQKMTDLGKAISSQFNLLVNLFSNPKQYFKKLGPFLFVKLVLLVTIIAIFLLLKPSK